MYSKFDIDCSCCEEDKYACCVEFEPDGFTPNDWYGECCPDVVCCEEDKYDCCVAFQPDGVTPNQWYGLCCPGVECCVETGDDCCDAGECEATPDCCCVAETQCVTSPPNLATSPPVRK